ncbi:uncharacterized protein EI97DRAFT_457560 [Westerdykella ornata]|uniref:C2H2-type domain-containing protein n=1 Tax=Westerdykella ornata TaxID=318751 RepID=A0A6A6JRJ4_WESOR|nr:uncharacterized protein EI97DRAFT_457560 [Westerdykella ornata]KAF2277559.1 hypothetical protein EI97DRAFT_457560 [Westerdykella ornata]
MTLWSPKHSSRSTTISRRLRNRADQNLSVQPPELPRFKAPRPHRAATALTPRQASVDYQTEQAHPSVWDPSVAPETFPRSNISNPSGLEQNAPSQLLLPQSLHLDFTPYQSPHQSSTDLVSLPTQNDSQNLEAQPTSHSPLIPTTLPSLPSDQADLRYGLGLSADSEQEQNQSLNLQDMSTLGYMMPAQYGSMNHYGDQSYQQSYADSRVSSHQPTSSGAYIPGYTSRSPAADQRSNILPPYQQPSVPRSPYQQPIGSLRTSPAPMYPPASGEAVLNSSQSYPFPALHPGLPGQVLSPLPSNSPSYPPAPIYPPTTYEISGYNTLPSTMYPPSSAAASYPAYEPSPGLVPPNSTSASGLPSTPSTPGNNVPPRVLNTRPKPQCWEHGCNGRQFSTFSNLLRHQREKSGTAAKSYCPRCGAEFTRTTARNGHMQHEKCKPRRTSDSSR